MSDFQDPIECYQAIGSALAGAAKRPWDRIVLEADLDGPQVDAVVASWRQGEPKPDYLTGVPRLASHVYDLARLISTPEKGLFNRLEFVLHADGRYETRFTYPD